MSNRVHETLVRITAAMLLCATVAANASDDEAAKSSGKEAHYVKFHPDFVVNLKADRPRFLMVTIQGMSRAVHGIKAAEQHMPAIRHELLMLLSDQTVESIKSVADKQRLMNEALERIQQVMVAETGEPAIEAVFFTDFVLE